MCNEYLPARSQNTLHTIIPIHYRRQSAAFGPTPTTLEGKKKKKKQAFFLIPAGLVGAPALPLFCRYCRRFPGGWFHSRYLWLLIMPACLCSKKVFVSRLEVTAVKVRRHYDTIRESQFYPAPSSKSQAFFLNAALHLRVRVEPLHTF